MTSRRDEKLRAADEVAVFIKAMVPPLEESRSIEKMNRTLTKPAPIFAMAKTIAVEPVIAGFGEGARIPNIPQNYK
jgi:hypothetical protein